MPLAEETRKKIFLWLVIFTLVAGAAFIIFAVFFNRGTLTINAEIPYRLQIGQFKTEICTEDPCSVVVAPGDYMIFLDKEGYREYTAEVSVPIAGEHIEEVKFSFIPYIREVGSEEDLNYFGVPTFENEDLPEIYFIEDNFVTWMEVNPENARQTLYYSEIMDGGLSGKTVATSFIRPLKDYLIFPHIEDRKKIILIDNADDESVLYIVDLSEKTKDNVMSQPLINGIKWIKGTDNFLLEARGEGEASTSIFTYDIETKDLNKLNLQTSIDNIAVISSNRLIAATMQSISGVEKDGELEGQLVTLGEQDATPMAGEITVDLSDALSGNYQFTPQLNFIDYSLEWNEARLLKTETALSGVEKVKLSADGKGIYFLSEVTVYELRFEE
jgi:hypothetical protein